MSGPLDELRSDLRECGDHPLSYGQETHGELHLAALGQLDRLEAELLARIEQLEAALRVLLDYARPVDIQAAHYQGGLDVWAVLAQSSGHRGEHEE